MTELSAETNPQILVNGEQQEQQQEDAAAAEEQISSVSLDEESSEDNVAAEKEKNAKMQSVFQQVRHQIRSQAVRKDKKNSILELMKLVKDMETARANGEPEAEEVSREEKKDDSKDEMDLKQEELCAMFEKKLEDCKKTLRAEFDLQVSQARAEMRAYTDQALSDWKFKTQSRQTCNLQPREQHESKNPEKKQKPSAPPSLVSRRGRVLTRTMTTIIPKTCAPVIVGPRAKSETLSSSKAESSRLLQRETMLHLSGNKSCHCRKPLLPPACPPLQQRKKPAGAKTKTGK